MAKMKIENYTSIDSSKKPEVLVKTVPLYGPGIKKSQRPLEEKIIKPDKPIKEK